MEALRGAIMTFAVVVTCTLPAYSQLPRDCPRADQELAANYARTAAGALVDGDAQRGVSLVREMETKLSPDCLAALDREQPARVQCTPKERNVVLDSYQRMLTAAFQQDLQRVFDLVEGLEASISSPCWLAVNRNTNPQIVQACSADELDTLASFAGPVVRASRAALEREDPSVLYPVLLDLQGRLSPGCNQALAMVAQQNARRSAAGSGGAPPQLPSAHDHGGGTYSVDGVGMCTPTECTPF